MAGDIEQVVRNRLRELRRGQRLPLWGLAVRAGTTPTTLSAIERWGYRPGAALCARIATALGGVCQRHLARGRGAALMEPASVTSAIDVRLIRILAQMALRILDQGLDAPSRESLSRGNPEPKGTQETSRDSSRGNPDRDGGEDAGTGHQSATGTCQ